jgi:hypothetical protein
VTPFGCAVTISSATLAIACVFLMISAYRQTGELLSPWILFLAMAVVDFYVPSAMMFTVGLDLPPWLSPLAADWAMLGVVVFTAGAAFFALGYMRGQDRHPSTAAPRSPSPYRLVLLACTLAVLVFIGLQVTIREAGGLDQYLSARLTNRFAAPNPQPGFMSLVASMRASLVPVLFVLAGVAFYDRIAHPVVGYAIPVLAAASAVTMLMRGTLLTLLMGLAIVERSRLRDLAGAGSATADAQWRRVNRRIILVCSTGVLVFVSYGSVRNYFTEQAAHGQSTVGSAVETELARFVRGEGFVGLMGIMQAYPDLVPYMGGRSIRDMLLLPVPRAVWPSKPLWYGIDDITRAMGWPASTMSAVTMPGELYANFSFWGVPLMWLYGWFFGTLRRHRFGPTFRYIYAFVFVPMMLPTFWMAFTGFVNQLVPIPLMLAALWFVFGGTPSHES